MTPLVVLTKGRLTMSSKLMLATVRGPFVSRRVKCSVCHRTCVQIKSVNRSIDENLFDSLNMGDFVTMSGITRELSGK